jgi:cyanophycinase-like exopeptidase
MPHGSYTFGGRERISRALSAGALGPQRCSVAVYSQTAVIVDDVAARPSGAGAVHTTQTE